jgi:hypothetical protein
MRAGGGRVESSIVLACAGVAAAVVAWQPSGAYRYLPDQRSLYDWSSWLSIGLLAAAGVAWLCAPSVRFVHRAAAVVAVAAGAQLAGTGVVAWRRWMTSAGWASPAGNTTTLRSLAVVLAVAGGVAALAGLSAMWRDGTIKRRPRRLAPVATLAVGAVVAVWLPFTIGYDASNRLTQVGAHALMYSLPWALVIVLVGWVDRITAYVGLGVVVLSAVPLLSDTLMVPAPHADRGFTIVLFAAIAALVGVGPPKPASQTTDEPDALVER